MIARFLTESSLLRTDPKDLVSFVKSNGYGESYIQKVLAKNPNLLLMDGKPGYWFVKEFPGDLEKTIIVFSYSFDDVYGTKRDYITIYCHNIFAQSTSAIFGQTDMTEEEIKKQSAIVRNTVKMMSKTDSLKKMQGILSDEEAKWGKYR